MDFEQNALHLAAEVVPAARVTFYRVGSDLEPHSHVVLGGDTRWIAPYMSEYRRWDPIHPRYFSQSRDSVFRLADAVCAPDQLERYRDGFQRQMGVRYKAEVFLRDATGRIVAGIRLARPAEMGDFDGNSIRMLELMQPVLCAALRGAASAEVASRIEDRLTKREREVLGAVLEGIPNKVICKRLGLALPTVKCHINRLLHKAGASNRAELLARIYRANLADCPGPRRPRRVDL